MIRPPKKLMQVRSVSRFPERLEAERDLIEEYKSCDPGSKKNDHHYKIKRADQTAQPTSFLCRILRIGADQKRSIFQVVPSCSSSLKPQSWVIW